MDISGSSKGHRGVNTSSSRQSEIWMCLSSNSIRWKLSNVSHGTWRWMLIGIVVLVCLILWRQNEAAYPIKKSVDLRVIVIVFNRAQSLAKLLDSLSNADYMGDHVVVDIWIDRSTNDVIDSETYQTAVAFQFKHGEVIVHNQTGHVGIRGQWMDTWRPAPDSKEIALILEDDLSVSPHFYRWLKAAHSAYGDLDVVNGFSLQGYSVKHGKASGNLRAPDPNIVLLYPILGCWGFSPKRENWEHFRAWYKVASQIPSFSPLVPYHKPHQWYTNLSKLKQEDSMWEIWHLCYSWVHKEFTLYPNLPNSQGLTINRREAGLHYTSQQTEAAKLRPDPLLMTWDEKYVSFPREPIYLNENGIAIKDVIY
jgi:glycosyltransferase involved in cell wall biosynthesis